MEAWRVPCTGRCWEVCANSADVGHTASVSTDVIATSAFLKKGWKRKHMAVSHGCAPELCQGSVCSGAALTPPRPGCESGQCMNWELCTALIPCTSNPTCASPVPCPQTPPLKSKIPDSTAYQERYSRALLFLLSRPIWMSQLSISCCDRISFPCPTHSSGEKRLFPSLHLPLTDMKTSLPSHGNQPSHPSCHPYHCFSPVISS